MASPTSFVETLESDTFSIGTILKSMSVNMAEALSYTDISFLFVDRQHGSPVFTRLENIVRAADLNDLPVAVRVPRDDMSMITYFLDLGVRGIVLPQVESPDYVREVGSHVWYDHGRSLGTTTRAARFGDFERSEYIDYVNDHLALIPMVETTPGLENVEALAAMDDVTALLVGPGDLAHSLGTEFWSDTHLDAIGRVFDAAAANGVPAGIFVSTERQIADVKAHTSFVIYGKDIGIVTDHMDEVVARERS
jgi:4-hydroxy-2-oxoheptanedioate aldolase